MNPCRLTLTTPLETQSRPQLRGWLYFNAKIACNYYIENQ